MRKVAGKGFRWWLYNAAFRVLGGTRAWPRLGQALWAVVAVTILACAPAQASVLSNVVALTLEQAREVSVGPAYWYTVTGGAVCTTQVVNVAVKVTDDKGPLCPTSVKEVWPWAKASLRVEFPFGASDRNFVEPKGIGVSERVQVASIQGAPIVFGLGYLLTQGGLAMFTSVDLMAWRR